MKKARDFHETDRLITLLSIGVVLIISMIFLATWIGRFNP
jgi:hypothetical protein